MARTTKVVSSNKVHLAGELARLVQPPGVLARRLNIGRNGWTKPKPLRLDLASIIKTMGMEWFIEQVGVRRIIEVLGAKRIIKQLGVKRIVEALGGVKWIWEELSPEQRRPLKQLAQE